MKNTGDIDPNQNATIIATPTKTAGDSDNNADDSDCGQINNTCDECGGSGKTIASPQQHTARCKSRLVGRIVVPRADDCRACQPSPAAAVSSDDDIDDDSISENDSSDSDYVDDDDENAIEMPSKKRMRVG